MQISGGRTLGNGNSMKVFGYDGIFGMSGDSKAAVCQGEARKGE